VGVFSSSPLIVVSAFVPGKEFSPLPLGLAFATGTIALLVAVSLAFGLFRGQPASRRSWQEIRAERDAWDAQGRLIHQPFQARRAFQVAEAAAKAPHYFLEMSKSSFLYLSGEFLKEYEPATTCEEAQSRRFPCTEFTIRRLRENNAVVDLLCAGDVLEPELITPDLRDYGESREWVREEAALLRQLTYEEIKADRLAEMRKRR